MRQLGKIAAALFGMLMLGMTATAPAHAGESYPIDDAAMVIDPTFCDGQRVTGHVEGAEPGTQVTITMVFTLPNGTEVTRTQTVTVDADGRADFGTDFPPGKPQSVVVSTTGLTQISLDPFEFNNTVDLTKCYPTDPLVPTGSNSLPWLRLGGAVVGAGLILVLAAMRRRSNRQPAAA